MKHARLGTSGLVVSKVCWGAANLGTPLPMFASAIHLTEAQAREATAIALDHGVNFFDTADLYSNGEAEAILGRCLAARRQDVVISTKVGLRTGEAIVHAGLSRRHILRSVDASLARLGTDWIDVYIAHKPDPHTPLEETLAALDQTVRDGKVRYLGCSNWPDWMVAKAAMIQRQNNFAPFVTGQLYYSLIGRELEEATIPALADAGIGLMVWSPLAGGYLTGKYTLDRHRAPGKLDAFSFVPIDVERASRVVETLDAVADRHGTKPATVALAWLLTRPAVSTVLLGVTRVEQLSANLEAMTLSLTADDLEALDAVSTPPHSYPHWYNRMLADPVTASIA